MKKLLPFPRQRQIFADDCGADAAACVIAACGQDVREDKVLALGHTSADGTETDGILRTFDYYGIKYHAGCGLQADELLAAIDCGHPVLITLQAYRDSPETDYAGDLADGHYVVVKGYDTQTRRFIIQDPSSWTDMYIGFDELDGRWHDVEAEGNRIEHWGCVVLTPVVYDPAACEHLE
jgi:ABC-type bacteriocin/lantibiotic exporter with double-glycine peptidase domain